ncbi:hypothetical protein HZ326_28809 [Fusarium oxysporum f. sp. albedinis]|nr:hypothetical protein HZ326_28809 [Fusarium oxysporum f. sp. albedinis]
MGFKVAAIQSVLSATDRTIFHVHCDVKLVRKIITLGSTSSEEIYLDHETAHQLPGATSRMPSRLSIKVHNQLLRYQNSSASVSQAGHGLNDPQEQQPLVIKLGDLK